MRANKSQRDLTVYLTRRSTRSKLEIIRVDLPQSFVCFFDKLPGLHCWYADRLVMRPWVEATSYVSSSTIT